MLSHFRCYYLLWMTLLLLVLVCSGCTNSENHKKILGTWANEAGVVDGESLPTGCMILTFDEDKHFKWAIPFSLETYTGKFSCRSTYIYFNFDKAMPGVEKKLVDKISFDGDNRMNLGNNKTGVLHFVRIGLPRNGSGNSGGTSGSSDTNENTKKTDATAPSPVAESGNKPVSSPSTMDEESEKRALEARKKFEEEIQKQQAEWDAKLAENRKKQDGMKSSATSSGPKTGTTQPSTFSPTMASDVVLDPSQKKTCNIPKSMKSVQATINGNSQWKLTVETNASPQYPAIQPITLEIPKTEHAMFTKPSRLLLSDPAPGVGVVSWNEQPFAKPKWAWINVLHLHEGTAVTKKLLFQHTVQDISPSGKYLAMTASVGEWPAERNGLVIFKISDGSFKQMLLMTPFDDAPDNVRTNRKVKIDTVRWLDEKRLWIGSSQGVIVCLDISKNELICGITLHTRNGNFEMTPDKKYLVVSALMRCMVFDANSGQQVGLIVPNTQGENAEHLSDKICFSPDGAYMACISNEKTGIWDLVSGGYLVTIPGGEVFSDNVWVGNQYIFAANRLIDVRNGVSLVNYQSAPTAYANAGDNLAYILQQDTAFDSGNQQLSFTIADPVPPDLAQMHQKLQQSNEQIMGPGDSISVSLAPDANIPAGDAQQILNHFSSVLKENGLNVIDGDGGDFKLTVTRSALSEPETLRYQEMFTDKRVEATFRSYSELWTITRDGVHVFGSGYRATPCEPEDFDKNYQEQIDKEMRVSTKWFCSQKVPKVITKAMSGEASKGVGVFSADGVQFTQ